MPSDLESVTVKLDVDTMRFLQRVRTALMSQDKPATLTAAVRMCMESAMDNTDTNELCAARAVDEPVLDVLKRLQSGVK